MQSLGVGGRVRVGVGGEVAVCCYKFGKKLTRKMVIYSTFTSEVT